MSYKIDLINHLNAFIYFGILVIGIFLIYLDCVNNDDSVCPYGDKDGNSAFIKLFKDQKDKGTFFELFGVLLAGLVGIKTLMECICWT